MLRHEGILFMRKIKEGSLYLVISEECGRGRDALEVAGSAIAGGVDIIQMREKNKTPEELKDLAVKLAVLCKKRKIPLIINDDPALAKDADADGVHLGQEDLRAMSLATARELLGPDKIIGVSTHSPEEFKAANESGADYIAFGPIFPTKTKEYCIGTKDIKNILTMAEKPVFFIGGINLSNISELIKQGARNIALIRGIAEADDVESTAKRFTEIIRRREGQKIW